MLKGYKDSGTLAAEVLMTRANHKGAFLVVEGANDVRFWSPRRHRDCELVDGEGKRNVVGGIRRLDTLQVRGVLGVVDRDYDTLEGLKLESKNIVSTDAHDLECVLCRSSALDTVLAEFGSSAKIQNFEGQEGVDVRTGLRNRAEIFGRLRWAIKRFELEIDPGLIRIPRFVDQGSWTVDCHALICTVGGLPSGENMLSDRVAELPHANPWEVVRGHDLMELLRIGLMRVLGDLPPTVGTKELSRVLRAAISSAELQATDFGLEVRAWEARNGPYAIFAEEDQAP